MSVKEEYCTVKEAAQIIGVEYKTLMMRISRGRVPQAEKINRVFLLPRSAVSELRTQEQEKKNSGSRGQVQ